MYSWIWRHLPFRRWYLKLGLSLAMIAGVTALLWYFAFPWAEPLLPFDDVQVTDDGGGTGGNRSGPGADQVGPDETAAPGDHDLPYATDEPAATPTSTGIPR